ncbi:DUF6544 family protein [Synechococcus sp. C9]|jgi:hypothetical protein|uniref:DUF6920 family protein n=1 Tax=Synechococcus sp. C9 TaxID=102119 RepID=UPI001FF31461|nr:DUF6544 family protein [Synechococcus sp. C9]
MWKMILLVILRLLVIITVALLYGISRWQSSTREMHEKLEAARLPIEPRVYDSTELNGLPAPVQRYFRAVLKDGQPMVLAVSVEHTGTFNMSETGEQWRSFTSTQRVITRRPGFDWEARVAMMPGLTVRVHDAYIAGEGILHASLFGLVSLVNLRGTPEVAQGELMRFFAETAWYPTALLPSQGVQWEPVNDASAKATLKDGETTLTMLFRFNEDGLIASMRAEARGRTVAGAVIPTPWEGRWSNYKLRDGMLIPLEGEVAWILPEGPKPYWRGGITRLSYEFTQ